MDRANAYRRHAAVRRTDKAAEDRMVLLNTVQSGEMLAEEGWRLLCCLATV
jgi:hypothetical protein